VTAGEVANKYPRKRRRLGGKQTTQTKGVVEGRRLRKGACARLSERLTPNTEIYGELREGGHIPNTEKTLMAEEKEVKC